LFVFLQLASDIDPNSLDECCICLERKPDVILPCTHSYCLPCIEQWNVDHKTCPGKEAKITRFRQFVEIVFAAFQFVAIVFCRVFGILSQKFLSRFSLPRNSEKHRRRMGHF
jgi:hypothetical protein